MTKRERVYQKFAGRCAYCGFELPEKWQVDHAISKYQFKYIFPKLTYDVNDIENLLPACIPCNHYKRALCIEEFRVYLKDFHIRFGRIPTNSVRPQTIKRKEYMQQIAIRYGITIHKPFSGKFYFELKYR